MGRRRTPDPLPRGREEGVGDRGRDGGHARLAQPARLLPARNDVDLDPRHLIKAEEGVVVEVALLHAPALEGDLAMQGRGEPEGDRALDLGRDRIGVHDLAAVDGADDAVDPHLPPFERHLGDLGHEAPKRLVDGETPTVALRQRADRHQSTGTPTTGLCNSTRRFGIA